MENDSNQPRDRSRNPLARAWNILFRPTKEWQIVEADETTWWYVCLVYIMPFTALAPLAWIIRVLHPRVHVSSVVAPYFDYDYNAVVFFSPRFILGYVVVLIATSAMVLVINVSVLMFSGKKALPQALKLVAYASTPLWLGEAFLVIVNEIFRLNTVAYTLYFILFVIYAGYLLYLGLPVLMKTPPEKTLLYMGEVTGIFLAYAVLVDRWPRLLGLRLDSLWLGLRALVRQNQDLVNVVLVVVAFIGLAIFFGRRKERSTY